MTGPPAAGAQRLAHIDGLRGLFALGVMLFHFAAWSGTGGEGAAGKIRAAVGLYFVDGFFIISGLSLSLGAFKLDWKSWPVLAGFAIRRGFRIYPLYAFATLVSAALLLAETDIAQNLSGLIRLMLVNITLLFGFADASRAIPVGGWSLALEVVFYCLFPLLILAAANSRARTVAVAAAGAAVTLASGALLDDAETLAGQWRAYVRPWQHIGFFTLGIMLASFRSQLAGIAASARLALALAAASAFCGLALHAATDTALAAPAMRGGFMLALSAAVIAVIAPVNDTSILARLSAWLGQISYGLYILHPVVYRAGALLGISGGLLTLLAVAVTPLLATLLYRWIEAPLIAMGAALSRRAAAPAGVSR